MRAPHRILAVTVAVMTASGAAAAVFEIGDDGGMVRIDTPVVPAPANRGSSPHRAPRPGVSAAQRAAAMRPYVEQAAMRYAVSPALVDAIAHTESRYNQDAVSRAGAGGVMQLMPATARTVGVDRSDAADNIRGGTAYLRTLLNRFDGNVICTIAAYNAGPAAVSKARCIPPYKETVSYVAAVLDRLAETAR